MLPMKKMDAMYGAEWNILRERSKAELVAVRRLAEKATAASLSSHAGKNRRFLPAEARRSEEAPAAKRRKMQTAPRLVVEHIETPAERKPAVKTQLHMFALHRKNPPPQEREEGEIVEDDDIRGGASTRRQEQEERSRAREKARQELVDMESTDMVSDAVHPLDLKRFGIPALGYWVRTAAAMRRSSRSSISSGVESRHPHQTPL